MEVKKYKKQYIFFLCEIKNFCLGDRMYEEFKIILCGICNKLFLIVKNSFRSRKIINFYNLNLSDLFWFFIRKNLMIYGKFYYSLDIKINNFI